MNDQTTAEATDREERLKTAYTETELRCPNCRATWSPVVANFVNFGTDPKGREGMLRKAMHHAYCPACKYHIEVDHIFCAYDPDRNLVIQVRPAWEFKAGGGEEIYWSRLENLVEKWADVDVQVDIVFGFDELIEKHLGGQEAAEAAIERARQEREQDLASGDLAPGVVRDVETA
ncbi:MAG TPA: CpXC domain-containing protein [Thermomicrobiales bacterium]|jgi:hypothetical protein|nr:CpXC domain-containing protein [Thermomicrobiales bacterium]HQZ91044.1 CpXC domain-containing protein [Thermomicrobiales bacterium]HRA32510.1 CpXC domain-containing protein [Thermomicrobiales bacterium]